MADLEVNHTNIYGDRFEVYALRGEQARSSSGRPINDTEPGGGSLVVQPRDADPFAVALDPETIGALINALTQARSVMESRDRRNDQPTARA